MKLNGRLALAAPLASALLVHGRIGQFPIVDNVLGGVNRGPSATSGALRISAENVGGSDVIRTPNQLRSVVENSGICETTQGVYQASGYGDISTDGSIWFWFFAARNNPDTAPLALWFNGGPGSSSMIGLVQENGPCRINNDSDTVSPNQFSWNQRANVLYIDQPVGVGFSTGSKPVGTSVDAAHDIWTFMQIWLSDSRFSQYQNRSLAIWTESYGGHYGPAFASYFLSQNTAIAAGKTSGHTLNLKTLGIGNGLTDPLPQYQGILNYAENNRYRKFDTASIANANDSWNGEDGCQDRITACNRNGTDHICSDAQDYCNRYIVLPLVENINPYYTPNPPTDPYPRNATAYLNSVSSKIGADGNWAMTSETVYSNFAETGDWMRTSAPDLEKIINAGVRTLIYDGDADFIVNYQGVELMLDGLNTNFSEEYRRQNFSTYLVAGQEAGLYKNAGTLSYLRVFGAGHEVPAYTYGSLSIGQAALQMFDQIMADQALSNDTSSVTGSNNGSNNNGGPGSFKDLRHNSPYILSSMLALLGMLVTLHI